MKYATQGHGGYYELEPTEKAGLSQRDVEDRLEAMLHDAAIEAECDEEEMLIRILSAGAAVKRRKMHRAELEELQAKERARVGRRHRV